MLQTRDTGVSQVLLRLVTLDARLQPGVVQRQVVVLCQELSTLVHRSTTARLAIINTTVGMAVAVSFVVVVHGSMPSRLTTADGEHTELTTILGTRTGRPTMISYYTSGVSG